MAVEFKTGLTNSLPASSDFCHSADNPCKQFESKLFVTLVFLKEFLKIFIVKKVSR